MISMGFFSLFYIDDSRGENLRKEGRTVSWNFMLDIFSVSKRHVI